MSAAPDRSTARECHGIPRPSGAETAGRQPAGLTLLPAVDVAGGRAAQVPEGPGKVGHRDDPREVAQTWVEQGAEWVHLVDLDRAFGRGADPDLLAALVADLPVPVQLSGGLADRDSLTWASGTGAARVVLSSSALADPDLVRDAYRMLGDRLVVAIDVRDGEIVSRGTALRLGPVPQVLARHPVLLTDVQHVLVADASRDGRRTGADLHLFSAVAGLLPGDVTASGGIATLDDLRLLRGLSGLGLTHAVLGAALYHRAFTLPEALEVCR